MEYFSCIGGCGMTHIKALKRRIGLDYILMALGY